MKNSTLCRVPRIGSCDLPTSIIIQEDKKMKKILVEGLGFWGLMLGLIGGLWILGI